jgi:acetyltransferase-like isoleucine patch superfamily enzyme
VAGSSTRPSAYEVFQDRRAQAIRLLYGAFKARTCGAESFGRRPAMAHKISFKLKGRAVFGDDFKAQGRESMVNIEVDRGGILIVGNNAFINFGVSIRAYHEVRIGDNALLAPFVSVIDDNLHETEPGAISYKGPVIVGNNVWLARNVAVMPGVSIGDGSVVGANSVVTKDIPPNSFAAGMPARVLRKLEIPDGWSRD